MHDWRPMLGAANVDPLSYPELLFTAAMIALLATPAVRRLALATGAMAMPVARGVHKHPVPQLGGLAIFLAFGLTLTLWGGLAHPPIRAILLGGALIVALGVIDDLVRLKPWTKLVGQTLVAVVTVLLGVQIEWVTHPLTGGLVMLHGWGMPLTVLWIVAVTNVMNLIDGLDGLAAGISTIAAITLLFTALHVGLPAISVLLSAALAGSALGFLPFNFNPAKIFMGDAGSMFLGFGLAVVSVEGLLKSMTAVTLVIPILALGLPIADTFLAILRRVRAGRPIGEADRGHLHHRLLDLGLSHRDAVIVLYIVSGWLGISAWTLSAVGPVQAALIVAFVVSSLAYLLKRFDILPREQRRVRS